MGARHCFELGRPGCSSHRGFQLLAPLQRTGSPWPGEGGAGHGCGLKWQAPCSIQGFPRFMAQEYNPGARPSELHHKVSRLGCGRPSTCLTPSKSLARLYQGSLQTQSSFLKCLVTQVSGTAKITFFCFNMKNSSTTTPTRTADKSCWLKAERNEAEKDFPLPAVVPSFRLQKSVLEFCCPGPLRHTQVTPTETHCPLPLRLCVTSQPHRRRSVNSQTASPPAYETEKLTAIGQTLSPRVRTTGKLCSFGIKAVNQQCFQFSVSDPSPTLHWLSHQAHSVTQSSRVP